MKEKKQKKQKYMTLFKHLKQIASYSDIFIWTENSAFQGWIKITPKKDSMFLKFEIR